MIINLQILLSFQFQFSCAMKHESNPPKGTAMEASSGTTPIGTSRTLLTDSKSIFDISNDELMSFLSGNNDSLNFLDIKEPTARPHNDSASDQTVAHERPRRTSRKAWVSPSSSLVT